MYTVSTCILKSTRVQSQSAVYNIKPRTAFGWPPHPTCFIHSFIPKCYVDFFFFKEINEIHYSTFQTDRSLYIQYLKIENKNENSYYFKSEVLYNHIPGVGVNYFLFFLKGGHLSLELNSMPTNYRKIAAFHCRNEGGALYTPKMSDPPIRLPLAQFTDNTSRRALNRPSLRSCHCTPFLCKPPRPAPHQPHPHHTHLSNFSHNFDATSHTKMNCSQTYSVPVGFSYTIYSFTTYIL